VVKLTSEEVAEITKIAKEGDLPGGRYPASMNDMLYAESPALVK